MIDLSLDHKEVRAECRNGILFKKVEQSLQAGSLLGCSLCVKPDDQIPPDNGILSNHAYAILDCKSVRKKKFIMLRNPNSYENWQGR